MFILLLFALAAAGFLHGKLRGIRSRQERMELALVYLLAGYCGIIMTGVSIWAMFDPATGANMLRTEAGSPFQDFFMVAYLGMAVMAAVSIWIRGTFLIANVICWSIYWFGATYLHLADYAGTGDLSFGFALRIIAAHALAPIMMIILLWLSMASGKDS